VGGVGDKQQLSIAPISGASAAKPLTDLRGSMSSPRWSPDGKRLVFSVSRKDHSFIVIADVKDDALQALHYVAPSADRDFAPRWSPDGSAIAYLKIDGFEAKRPLIPERTQSWSIWIGDSRTYKSRELWKGGKASRDFAAPLRDGIAAIRSGEPSGFRFRGGRVESFVFDCGERRHGYAADTWGI